MKLFEMEGFLRGKCIPRDLKVNETNAEYLVRKFAEADAMCAALAAENAGLKEWSPNPHSASIFEAIEKAEALMDDGMPELAMIKAFEILKMKRTPATDDFLAEVRAQGVEMLAEHLSGMNISASETSVREFATQLREGVQS